MGMDTIIVVLVFGLPIAYTLAMWVIWRDRSPNDSRDASRDELRAARARIRELTADRNFYARRADARSKRREKRGTK